MHILFREIINNIRLTHRDIAYYLGLLEEADLSDIHYGYWHKKPTERISYKHFANAQKRLSALAVSFIPRNYKNVLDIGGGVGGFSHYLTYKGYSPVCIVPDKNLINFGIAHFHNCKFFLGSAEYFKIKNKSDAAFLFESLQYFTNKERALKNIYNHLKMNGRIIIIDEFFNSKKYGLMNDAFLIEFLTKRGFTLIDNLDITNRIIPTCDFIINYSCGKQNEIFKMWTDKKLDYLNKTLSYRIIIFDKIS
ncbi:class I SAM-dependent methyltransferase [Candidatus Pacearchaeota archaeon]|nr:class I SAM-dependent methyltransferase [Candidatus Pacearchaeota archaeon]